MTFDENKLFKILVVDDNPVNIQVIGNLLRKSEYIIGYATNGRQAVDLLQSDDDYDLVLLDVDMPVMDGYEACRIIRTIDKLKEIPIIFLTAYRETENVVKGLEYGAQDYISKPYDPKELLVRVNTHLQLKHKSDMVRQMNQILEQRVEERTHKLKEANEKLAVLDNTKNDFLALISHEMRTPLSGIVGFAKILKAMIQDPEQKEFAEYLVQSADRLNMFSEIALLITKLKLQSYEFKMAEHNIKSLVNTVIKGCASRLEAKEITLTKKFDTDRLNIAMDESLIMFSIKGIISNALTYGSKGGKIMIHVSLEDKYLKIAVTDNGPGFSEEALSKIFELFAAVDLLHHAEGYGLSLATVKLIADLHKGKVEAKNLETGAEVDLYIPVEI
jgi:two-component system, sensor histidine kinase and response regulator